MDNINFSNDLFRRMVQAFKPQPINEVEDVQEVVVSTGAVQFMESHITELRDQAVNALQKSELAGDAYAELVALAEAVTQRQR